MSEAALQVLDKCKQLIVERGGEHGEAEELFKQLAIRSSIRRGVRVTPSEVSMDMVEFKLGRNDLNWREDNILDAINYLALALALRTENVEEQETDPHTV
tara:strand:+ start:114 stop:413 length:300 start_codon:yes stop_codon:yes gene_type:complete